AGRSGVQAEAFGKAGRVLRPHRAEDPHDLDPHRMGYRPHRLRVEDQLVVGGWHAPTLGLQRVLCKQLFGITRGSELVAQAEDDGLQVGELVDPLSTPTRVGPGSTTER